MTVIWTQLKSRYLKKVQIVRESLEMRTFLYFTERKDFKKSPGIYTIWCNFKVKKWALFKRKKLNEPDLDALVVIDALSKVSMLDVAVLSAESRAVRLKTLVPLHFEEAAVAVCKNPFFQKDRNSWS